jgi:molecular chaperone DnaK (HSP70)
MENALATNALKDTHEILSRFLEQAHTKGRAVEGDVISFIRLTASDIEKFVRTVGEELRAAGHALHLNRLAELAKSMFKQIEENEELESFWEEMVEEIPDLIEWIQNLLEKGGEIAADIAEVAGEVAVETADIAEIIATEV